MSARLSATSDEAKAVLAFMDDVRKMRKLAAALGPSDGALVAETQKMNAQIARSLRRQRKKLQSVLDAATARTLTVRSPRNISS